MDSAATGQKSYSAISTFVDVTEATAVPLDSGPPRLPKPSHASLEASRTTSTLDVKDVETLLQGKGPAEKTVLYLAYGSNLSVEKFRKARGIQPIAQINVQVPSLRLTFDLPGIAYREPCFANSGLRDAEHDRPNEKFKDSAGNPVTRDYHKDRWHKGLIGVVYEVTLKDYAHIIATEGGGASYKDIVVDCYPFESDDANRPVPQDPRTASFRAHTLFAPAETSSGSNYLSSEGGRVRRADPSYAQPSSRYLKLITDGAAELGLPLEYQAYLQQIRPYTMTTTGQRVGGALFLAIWGPLVMLVFGLGRVFADKEGRLPKWLQVVVSFIFSRAWVMYDNVFLPVFGDGERTITDTP